MVYVLAVVTLQCLQIKAQLHVSSSDYDSLRQRCHECRATLKLLAQLVELSDGFRDIDKLIAVKSYKQATLLLATVCDILTDINAAHGNDLAIFPSLVRKQTMLKDDLEKCVMHRWKEMVNWSGSPAMLTVVCGSDAHQELQQLSQSLYNLGCLSSVIAKLASQVMVQFVNRLLTDSDTSCDIDIKHGTSSLSLQVVATVTPATQPAVVRTMRTLELFTAVMETLYENLLNINVSEEVSAARNAARDNVAVTKDIRDGTCAENNSSSTSLMSVFGKQCSAACLEALISHCLSSAIPSHRSELAQFSQVAAAVEDLQMKLVMFGFISEDNKVIVDYMKNIDVLFTNKRCVELLDEARKLIKSDIHNIIQVTTTDLY